MAQNRFEIRCIDCDWQATSDETDVIRRLRGIGMLAREAAPSADLIAQLLPSASRRMACDRCGAVGLRIESVSDDVDWGDPVRCQECGQAISPERLEVFPDVKVCRDCQVKIENGDSAEFHEYCPRCGEIMQVSSRRTGLAGYRMKCGQCGYSP